MRIRMSIRQTSPFYGRARVHKIKSHELQFAFGISWNIHASRYELFMFMGGIADYKRPKVRLEQLR